MTLGLKYENAKSIYKAFRKEKRITKFKNCRTRDYGEPHCVPGNMNNFGLEGPGKMGDNLMPFNVVRVGQVCAEDQSQSLEGIPKLPSSQDKVTLKEIIEGEKSNNEQK